MGRLLSAGVLIAMATAALAADADRRPRDDVVSGPVPASVLGVIDGDTIAVRARIWLGQSVETRVRIAGVDAPELRGACQRERALAAAARDLVVGTIEGAAVTLWDIRYDKFGGRVLARVVVAAGDDIAALLIAAGLGRAYDGGKRAPWCETPPDGS